MTHCQPSSTLSLVISFTSQYPFVVMREHWIHIVHLFVKAVELHYGIAVAILLTVTLFMSVYNSVVTVVSHCV